MKNKIAQIIIGAILFAVTSANLALSAPPPGITTAPYTVSYSGRLTDSAGNAVTATQTVRFSLWTDADFDALDLLVTGDIDPVAGGFTGWFEEHTVTPDSNGLFHAQLGSITTLPNVTLATHLYLQVDVKPVASPKTSYEVLDPTGSTADLTDRHPLNSSFYTINADTVDNADTGTGPGNIVMLDGSSLFPVSTIPGGTNVDSFTIDSDDSVAAGTIPIVFGTTLAKVIEYDLGNSRFNINDNVNITGGVEASGKINFAAASEFHMREVADEAAAACTTVSELVLDTTENVIYSCTAPGAPGTWASTAAPSYAQSLVIEPEYEDAVIVPDGTSNKGKLQSFFVDTDGSPGNANINYYRWTTRQAGLQDIDLVLRVNLPERFSSFQATPLQITYRTADANTANNKIDVTLEDTAGTAVALTGGSNLVSGTFATGGITLGGAPTFTAGQPITLKIKLSALSTGFADIGRISLNYIYN
ncbi:hypothetical protein KJ951_03720 [Patescibacteria group bacterium]|nr:hypothetical protein [Patescibacteria group bacterium]MBU1703485.1 hypothetical protein [Patescibacteria group bacterium]MBU1953701.1 hypothetical protein [Patescibacteria group bacterium]